MLFNEQTSNDEPPLKKNRITEESSINTHNLKSLSKNMHSILHKDSCITYQNCVFHRNIANYFYNSSEEVNSK